MHLTKSQKAPQRVGHGIRWAGPADLDGHVALVAPHVALGTVLPRPFDPLSLLVVPGDAGLDGAVSLTGWGAHVVEVGGLVAARPGCGMGRRLLAAAEEEAVARGHRWVVALTGEPGFFERHGYRAVAGTPWLAARRMLGQANLVPIPSRPGLAAAVEHKGRACISCPRLAGCAQALLVKELGR